MPQLRPGNLHLLPRKHRATGQQKEQGRTEAVQIAARVGSIRILDLLRRHELGRSHEHSPLRLGHFGGGELRQSEVEDLQDSFLVQHHVSGLDVAVDDPQIVSILQRPSRLFQYMDGFDRGHRSGPTDAMRQQLSLDQLHHQVQFAPHRTRIESGHDVGVHQPSDGADLRKETFHKILPTSEFTAEDLQRHVPVHGPVLRTEHLPHPSRSDGFQQQILPEHSQWTTTGRPLRGIEFEFEIPFLVGSEPRRVIEVQRRPSLVVRIRWLGHRFLWYQETVILLHAIVTSGRTIALVPVRVIFHPPRTGADPGARTTAASPAATQDAGVAGRSRAPVR